MSKAAEKTIRNENAGLLSVACFMLMLAASSVTAANVPWHTVLDIPGAGYVDTGLTAGDLGIAGNAAKTVEAWVYQRKFIHGGGVFSMGIPRRTRDFGLISVGAHRWRLQYWSDDVDFEHPVDGRWVHMAMVYTGSESIMYVDGEEVVREARSSSLNTDANGPIRIGIWQNSSFDGKISDVRIWDRALKSQDILERMSRRLKGNEPGLVAYWPLDAADGEITENQAGDQDGQLIAGARYAPAKDFEQDLTLENPDILPGETVVLGPVQLATPKGKVTYQWYFEEEQLEGATGEQLVLSDITKDRIGTYYVIANDARAVTPVESAHVELKAWPDSEYLVQVSHPTMNTTVGCPAIIEPRGSYPSLKIASQRQDIARFEGRIVEGNSGEIVAQIEAGALRPRQPVAVKFPGQARAGRYQIQLMISADGKLELIDTYHFVVMEAEQVAAGYSLIVHPGEDGKLAHIPDYRGNRIPDFSHVGYKGGGEALPDVAAKVTLTPEAGDNLARIQAAIDEVSAMEPAANGFRGTVLLKKGVYEISGTLEIKTSGVVLRGEGVGGHGPELFLEPEWLDPKKGRDLEDFKKHIAPQNATVLIRPARATRTAVLLANGGGIEIDQATKSGIVDNYVPVGAFTFRIENPEQFQVGDKILVNRVSNAAWIRETGMEPFWSRGPRAFPEGWPNPMERTITAIDGNRITIHSPIVNAIEKQWGGGQIYRYDDAARLEQVGFENMRLILYSPQQGGKLSHVRGTAVLFKNVRDAWTREIVAEHFCDRAFSVTASARVTMRDCGVLLAPWEYFSGYVPRYGFNLENSTVNHVLIEGCYANHTRHPFVLSAWIPGPNVFLDCRGYDNGATGPHHRWSVGGLFDNVAVGNLEFRQRAGSGSGHGWAGANYVAWNTSGRLEDGVKTEGRLIVEKPPTAQNWAIGHLGQQSPGQLHGWNLSKFGYSFGYWESAGQHVKPQSLYLQQLEDRLGREASARHRIHRVLPKNN